MVSGLFVGDVTNIEESCPLRFLRNLQLYAEVSLNGFHAFGV